MDIALISLYGINNLGSRHLHSVLKRHGHNVHFIFFKEASFDDFSPPTLKEYETVIDLLRQCKPSLISISVGAFVFAEIAEKLSQKIKENFSAPMIWGGVYPTLFPERCGSFSDFICIGDGEDALPELVSALASGGSADNIENIWAIKKTGIIIKNPIRKIKKVIEYFPDFSDENKYHVENNRVLQVEPLRQRSFEYHTQVTCGCPFSCNFCSETSFKRLYGHGSTVRSRSVRNIIDELASVKRSFPDISFIAFSNEIFPQEPQWVESFSAEYKRQIDLPFFCFSNPICLNAKLLGSLKRAGLAVLEIGVQSGSRRIRENIFNRPETLNNISDVARECARQKVVPTLDFIVDNPYENKQDKADTLELIHSLERPFDVKLFSFTFMPGSVLTEKALEEGILSLEEVEKGFRLPRQSDSSLANVTRRRPRSELVYISAISLSAKGLLSRKAAMFLLDHKISTFFPLFQCLVFFTVCASFFHYLHRWMRYSQKKSVLKYIRKLPYYLRHILMEIQ